MEYKEYIPFGLAPQKVEGGIIRYDPKDKAPLANFPSGSWTYVERRIPTKLREKADRLIDALLKKEGYKDY